MSFRISSSSGVGRMRGAATNVNCDGLIIDLDVIDGEVADGRDLSVAYVGQPPVLERLDITHRSRVPCAAEDAQELQPYRQRIRVPPHRGRCCSRHRIGAEEQIDPWAQTAGQRRQDRGSMPRTIRGRPLMDVTEPGNPFHHRGRLVEVVEIHRPMTRRGSQTATPSKAIRQCRRASRMGGHVEPGEHPLTAARRETGEELGIEPVFDVVGEQPLFLTCTTTVGQSGSHVDISLWHVIRGDRARHYPLDPVEFNGGRWWDRDPYGLPRPIRTYRDSSGNSTAF
ncbi:NUDIX domain-containing protein [Nocardia sp. NBC_01730]|uniref:NUDIX domain-containing protein n=1 Tax=Nocardia sp. NBC_01730 TaxID=2975998 RepID=UPI003FA35DC5